MGYTNEDKYSFAIKDIKYSYGQGMGNAFQKAVDFYISDKNINRGISESDALMIIEGLRDMFFKSNQYAINKAFNEWLSENDEKLKLELGLITPVVDVDEVNL